MEENACVTPRVGERGDLWRGVKRWVEPRLRPAAGSARLLGRASKPRGIGILEVE